MKKLLLILALLTVAAPAMAATNAGTRTNGYWYVNTNVFLPELVREWNSNFVLVAANFNATTNKINSLVLSAGSNWVSIMVTNYAHIASAPTSNSHAVRLLELTTTSNTLVTLVATTSNGLVTIINTKTNTLYNLLTNNIAILSNSFVALNLPTNNPLQLAYSGASGWLTIISNVALTNPIIYNEIKGTNAADGSFIRMVVKTGGVELLGGGADATTNGIIRLGVLSENGYVIPFTNGLSFGSSSLRWRGYFTNTSLTNSIGHFTNLIVGGSAYVFGNNISFRPTGAAGSLSTNTLTVMAANQDDVFNLDGITLATRVAVFDEAEGYISVPGVALHVEGATPGVLGPVNVSDLWLNGTPVAWLRATPDGTGPLLGLSNNTVIKTNFNTGLYVPTNLVAATGNTNYRVNLSNGANFVVTNAPGSNSFIWLTNVYAAHGKSVDLTVVGAVGASYTVLLTNATGTTDTNVLWSGNAHPPVTTNTDIYTFKIVTNVNGTNIYGKSDTNFPNRSL